MRSSPGGLVAAQYACRAHFVLETTLVANHRPERIAADGKIADLPSSAVEPPDQLAVCVKSETNSSAERDENDIG